MRDLSVAYKSKFWLMKEEVMKTEIERRSYQYEFSRCINVTKLGGRPQRFNIVADRGERKKIAARLDWPDILLLEGDFTVKKEDHHNFLAHGKIKAKSIRQCVVSLEEFEDSLQDEFSIRFVPDDIYKNEDVTSPEIQRDGSVDELPYTGCFIDLGEAVVQQLSLVSIPYPHAPNIKEPFKLYVGPQGNKHKNSQQRHSPFTVLSNLKKKPQ